MRFIGDQALTGHLRYHVPARARAPSACGTQSVMESLVPTNGFLIPQDPQVPTDGNVLFAGSIHADVLTALEKNTFK